MVTDIETVRTVPISQRLADHIVGLRYEDLPDPVIDRAKELVLHHLKVALRGHDTVDGGRAIDLATKLSDAGGDCSIVGESRKADLLEAVFANSVLIIRGGLWDILLPSGGLGAAITHPVAWAIGESTGASGRDLLTAIAVGYDVMAKLHDGALPYELEVPRPSKLVVEPFGSAAAAARLLGLTRDETVHAMGHAGQSAMGTYEDGQHWWIMHALAARNGALAAMLAQSGLPSTSTIVEGHHGVYRTHLLQDVPDVVYDQVASLGQDFEIMKSRTMVYPGVSGLNVIPIELTQRLVAEHDLTPERVGSVNVVVSAQRRSRESIYGDYAGGPRKLVASVVAAGGFDPAQNEKWADAESREVLDKVQVRFEEGREIHYARIEITTMDGDRWVAGGDTSGSESGWSRWLDTLADDIAPTAKSQVDRWLAEAGRSTLSRGQLGRLEDLVRNLQDVSDVAEVMTCVVPNPPS